MLFLQILGGVLLTLVVIVALAIWFIKRKLKQFLQAPSQTDPIIIHLNEDLGADWLSDKSAKAYIEYLISEGFTPGTAYEIFELPDFRLIPYFSGPLIAVIYHHASLGVFIDIACETENGDEFTFSNAPFAGALDSRPNQHKDVDSSYSIDMLHNKAQELLQESSESFRIINEGEFRTYFENAYKQDQAWKARRGGITFKEFVKIAQQTGEKVNAEQMKEAFILTKEQELYQWQEAGLEHYQKQANISDEEFERDSHRLIFVPYTTSAKAFCSYLLDRGFINEKQQEKIEKVYAGETDIIRLFEKLNDLLSPEIRAALVSESDFPLKAKIYRLHQSMV